jgi:hypothetical protein
MEKAPNLTSVAEARDLCSLSTVKKIPGTPSTELARESEPEPELDPSEEPLDVTAMTLTVLSSLFVT